MDWTWPRPRTSPRGPWWSGRAPLGGISAPAVSTYAVRDLRRWPLRTPYTRIVDDVSRLVGVDLPSGARRPDQSPLRRPALVVDATGVGAAVVDLFRAARNRGQLQANLLAVLITAGNSTSPGEYAMHVPKKGARLRLAGAVAKQAVESGGVAGAGYTGKGARYLPGENHCGW